MEFVLLVIAAVVVVAVALVSVGWAVGKTSAMPDQIVIDAHEAIEFCAQALPDDVTATLSYDELRRLLRLHLEWIQFYHWAPEGDADGPVVFEELDALDYVMERADVVDLDVSVAHVAEVIKAHSAFLQVMGAIHLEDPVVAQADLADMALLDPGATAELAPGGAEVEPNGADHPPET